MDCKTCKESREVVSRHLHESDMDRMDRVNRRWFYAWLITFVLLVAGVVFFFWRESQFEDIVETTTTEVLQRADDGSNNTFVGGDYSVGDAESKNYDYEEEP